MKPKEFIQAVLINELEQVVNSHPYISFSTLAIGFEFLGKAIDATNQDWFKGDAKDDWERSIKELKALEKYREFLGAPTRLWDSIRNGYSHTFIPKSRINVSSKRDSYKHLEVSETGRVNIKCEEFYEDFKKACIEVINMSFPENDKMNKEMFSVINQ